MPSTKQTVVKWPVELHTLLLLLLLLLATITYNQVQSFRSNYLLS